MNILFYPHTFVGFSGGFLHHKISSAFYYHLRSISFFYSYFFGIKQDVDGLFGILFPVL